MSQSSGNDAQLQELRKELKKWESSFYFVHQRKPSKEDIDGAPKDVTDKYRQYYELKKTVTSGSQHKSVEDSGSSQVWGVEFNKTQSKSKHEDDLEKDKSLPSSLHDFGSKLYRSFSDTQQVGQGKKFKAAVKCSKPIEKGSCPVKMFSPKPTVIVTESMTIDDRKQGEPRNMPKSDGNENFRLSGDIFENSKLIRTGRRVKPQLDKSCLGLKFGSQKKRSFTNVVDSSFKFDDEDDNSAPNFKNNLSNLHIMSSSGDPSATSMSDRDTLRPDRISKMCTQTATNVKAKTSPLVKDFDKTPVQTKDSSSIPCAPVNRRKPRDSSNLLLTGEKDPNSTGASQRPLSIPAPADQDSGNLSCDRSSKVDSSKTEKEMKKTGPSARRVTKRKLQEAPDKPNTSLVEQVSPSDDGKISKFINSDVSQVTGEIPSVSQDAPTTAPTAKRPKQLSAPSTSTRTPNTGSALSTNYVCLNMKRKRYRRKGQVMTGVKWKRQQWKSKMAAKRTNTGSMYKRNTCFLCGQEGHWAQKCPRKGARHEPKSDEEMGDVMNEEEVLTMTPSVASYGRRERPPAPAPCEALCLKVEDIKIKMQDALMTFGLSSFRPGQEDCITRILEGQSTLLILPTGCGKSLCYQLPAYLYARHLKAVTLVISPLVSLMEDQVSGLPQGVQGLCLHSNMTKVQRENVLTNLQNGDVHFLLVSPEAVVGGGSSGPGSLPLPSKMPPIAFACIDEAHCISEWSHNFRPSYLRLCKVLRQRYGVQCFLGLSATATECTARDVVKHLGIENSTEATIRGDVIPSNLVLSVSRDEIKDEALINLLQGDRFRHCPSIIVYCTRREQTTRVATLIRTSFQKTADLSSGAPEPTPEPANTSSSGKQRGKKKKNASDSTFDSSVWTVESYHAGLTPAQRKRVQKAFMSGRLRVVVATVAFGMGLDKSDVRAVIHYSMAKSFESYVQEIGRAGRDGKEAHCHTFLHPEVS